MPCINQQHFVIVDMVYKGFEVFDGVSDDRAQQLKGDFETPKQKQKYKQMC